MERLEQRRARGRRTYAGVPMEARRAYRRRLLLDAGLQEIGTRGYDDVTVKDVCRTAGLTERYFYEHFPERHALLLAVYDDVTAAVMQAAVSAAEAAPAELTARTRAGLGAFVAALVEDPRRARVQLTESVGRGEELERRRAGVMDAFAAYIAAAAEALHPRPEIAAARRWALAAGVVGATNHLVESWLAGRIDLSRADLVETLVSLMLGVADAPDLAAAR